MSSEHMAGSTGPNPEQSADEIDRGLNELMRSVRKLVQETDALRRLRDQLVIHARQIDFDVQRLLNIQKQLKSQLETSQPHIERQPVRVPDNRFEDTVTEPARDLSPLALTNINWDVLSDSGKYNKQNVKLRYALNMDSVLCTIKFNGDGSLFAFADGKTVFIMNAVDGSLVGACEVPRTGSQQEARALIFSPDSRVIALTGPGNRVFIIEVATQKILKVLEGHTKTVTSMAFLSDSQTLITGGFDKLLCVWNLADTTQKKMISYGKDGSDQNEIVSLSVAPGDDFVAVGFMSGTVGIYEPTFSQPAMTFQAHNKFLLNVTVSPSGLIGTASHDKTAKVWLVRGVARCKMELSGHTGLVLTVAFAPKEPIVFTGSKDETIKCWDYSTGENLFTLMGPKNTVFQIDHHPTAKTIVSCSGDGLVCVWDYNF